MFKLWWRCCVFFGYTSLASSEKENLFCTQNKFLRHPLHLKRTGFSSYFRIMVFFSESIFPSNKAIVFFICFRSSIFGTDTNWDMNTLWGETNIKVREVAKMRGRLWSVASAETRKIPIVTFYSHTDLPQNEMNDVAKLFLNLILK